MTTPQPENSGKDIYSLIRKNVRDFDTVVVSGFGPGRRRRYIFIVFCYMFGGKEFLLRLQLLLEALPQH